MLTIHNPQHHLHQGRHEMFRGRLVPCHETPDRLDHVLAELRRRAFAPLRSPEVDGRELDAARKNPRTEVQLRADKGVPYGRVAEVIGVVQKAGLNRIGFVTEPAGAASR